MKRKFNIGDVVRVRNLTIEETASLPDEVLTKMNEQSIWGKDLIVKNVIKDNNDYNQYRMENAVNLFFREDTLVDATQYKKYMHLQGLYDENKV